MASNFGDCAGGFRHNEVISFINNEVLLNGGGPDFYTTLRSQSWNEIEDRLQAILTDPQVPRMRQRASTWSALALGVRVAARQYEHQMHRIQQLQDQVEEHKTVSWALAAQLRKLLRERDQAASELQSILTVLRQAKDERDMLCQRLLQVEMSTHTNPLPQVVQPVRGDQLRRAPPWPMNAEKQGKMVATGAHNMPHLKTQMATLGVKLYLSGNPSAGAQAVQPRLPIPAPPPLPFRAPFPKGLPYLTPQSPIARKAEGAVAGTVTAAAVPKTPPPGFCAAVEAQKKMASLSDQRGYPVMPQKYLLGNSKSQGQEKGPVMPQGYHSLGNSKSHGRGKGPLMPKCPEKQQPQEEKAKQAKGIGASESQHQGMSASRYNRQNWHCPWCKTINFSWYKFCYKCKKVCVPVQSGGLHPGQTRFGK
uniref:RanBP2-type domain-containing protein n=1 Tax=Myotis myotis TaxID=51298 RepID=A0A7J7YDL8_MYOMY|nr:hypothetical protein mMyoMyo1_011010 [Myotis myotis]